MPQGADKTSDQGTAPRAEPEILAMPGHMIRRMHQASQAIFDTLVGAAGYDLTSVQFAALSVIAVRPGLDQASLASAIAFDRATTGGVVDRLEAKGFVRREVPKSDRRARHLYIEPAGEAALEGVTPVARQAQVDMLQGLKTEERWTLLKLLAKALDAVGDASRAPAKTATRPARGRRRSA